MQRRLTDNDRYHRPYIGYGKRDKANATLINGKGRSTGNTTAELTAELSVINVQKGKKYRFRIISMVCRTSINFAIDGHLMTVIEADGEYTKPHVIDNMVIHSGQRYSVVVTADQPVGNYWVRSNPDYRGIAGFDRKRNLAIFRYAGAAKHDPTTTGPPNKLPLNEYDLRARDYPTAPGLPFPNGADVYHTFVTDEVEEDDPVNVHFTLNGIRWVPPTVPVLLQILSGAQYAQSVLPNGTVYRLPSNKVIEITLPGNNEDESGPVSFPMLSVFPILTIMEYSTLTIFMGYVHVLHIVHGLI